MGRFRWGRASKTDAVLVRHYDSQTGKETRERRVTIFLRASQTEEEVLLDLAHELVHATSQPPWDPYDPELTAARYIHAAIDGEGGEVAAVQAECRVHFELARHDPSLSSDGGLRCRSYMGKNSAEKIRRDFYRVGQWQAELRARLGKEAALMPELSSEPPALYSSTGGAPYPIALWEEFRSLTEAACENSRRRASSELEQKPPATLTDSERETLHFLLRRCSETPPELQASDT